MLSPLDRIYIFICPVAIIIITENDGKKTFCSCQVVRVNLPMGHICFSDSCQKGVLSLPTCATSFLYHGDICRLLRWPLSNILNIKASYR